MTIDAIAQASIGLNEEYIPMVVSYIDFLKSLENKDSAFENKKVENNLTPGDAIGVFSGSLLYMADDFNETPEEFKEYM